MVLPTHHHTHTNTSAQRSGASLAKGESDNTKALGPATLSLTLTQPIGHTILPAYLLRRTPLPSPLPPSSHVIVAEDGDQQVLEHDGNDDEEQDEREDPVQLVRQSHGAILGGP